MKLPLSIAESLLVMQNGKKIPFSQVKSATVETMIDNGILKKQILGRTKAFIYVTDVGRLSVYLKNHFGIENLEKYVEGLKQEDLTRAEAIDISSNSKLKSIRTFKGFLVNCFQPLRCILNDVEIAIQPNDGSFIFIYDFENFYPSDTVTIVGIENPFNFRYVQRQRKLFQNINPLFVSRYPQSKDLVKWLQTIQNRYLHFGDYDFAGLNIYINEYKKHLQERASFFMPPDIEVLLENRGNRDNYDNQSVLFDVNEIKEENVLALLALIKKYKKGLEQEIFAK